MQQDTSDAQIARYHRLLQAMTLQQRARATASLCTATHIAAMAGLRQRHPDASDDELKIRLMVRLYGRAAAERVFGTVMHDAI